MDSNEVFLFFCFNLPVDKIRTNLFHLDIYSFIMALSERLTAVISRLVVIKSQHLNKQKSTISSSSISNAESELVEVGSDLFEQFFHLGCQASRENLKSLRNLKNMDSLVANASKLIVENEKWLNRFLCCYPGFSIHFDEHDFIGKDVCIVRSGFQFLLDLFKDSNEEVNDTLKFLEDESVAEFDHRIRLAKECTAFKVRTEDVPDLVPRTHFWWF